MAEETTYEQRRQKEENARDFKGPITSPNHPLHQTANDIITHIGLGDEYLRQANHVLPLTVGEHRPWGHGDFQVDKRDGKVVGVVGFDWGIFTNNNPRYQETKIEELVHWLHASVNPQSRRESLKSSQERKDFYKMSNKNIGKSAAIIDGVRNGQKQHLAFFSEKTGIKLPSNPESESELRQIISYLLSLDENDYQGNPLIITRLSMGQTARLHTALSKMGIEVDPNTEKLVASCCTSYVHSQERIETKEGGSRMWERSDLESSHNLLLRKLGNRVNKAVKSGAKWRTIADAFEEVNIALDDPDCLYILIKEKFLEMSPSELKSSITNYVLRKPLTFPEIRTLSSLFKGSEKYKELMTLLRSAKNTDNEKFEHVREVAQGKLVTMADQLTAEMAESKGAKILLYLLDNQQQEVIKEKYLNTASAFILDDLPDDPTARKGLLKNQEYLEMARKAALSAINQNSTREETFQAKNIAADKTVSSRTRKQFLQAPLSQLEQTAFVIDTTKTTESYYFFKGFRSLALNANRHYDGVLTKGEAGRRYGLYEIPSPDDFNQARQVAFGQSQEFMRLEQKINTLKHIKDVLKEPIAKVVVAQMTGGTFCDVEFPTGMLGGYSDILRTDDARQWVEKLWRFTKKVKSKGGEGKKVFDRFLHATDLQEQLNIVNTFLEER